MNNKDRNYTNNGVDFGGYSYAIRDIWITNQYKNWG